METFMQSDKIAIIIPARYASTRLPGKPLLKVNNKPIIQWVYERAMQSKLTKTVIVATDDNRIREEVESFGGKVFITSSSHQSGSDRIAEVAKSLPNIDVIVNVQGDEPLITPESIDGAIDSLIQDAKADISTLIRVIDDKKEQGNPNIVKVVKDNFDYAMYFSRAAIPYERETDQEKLYAHIGLYAYRKDSLFKMTEFPQSDLEKTECLEQLRALQYGMKIKTRIVDYKPIGIDTPEDLEEFREYAKTL